MHTTNQQQQQSLLLYQTVLKLHCFSVYPSSSTAII
uniref:Uncharacterized protein n=1 Tax=Arundo donax TaxID=35708 RepID=A0A0A9ANB3_ARUDO